MSFWRVTVGCLILASVVSTGLLLPLRAEKTDKDAAPFDFKSFLPVKDKDGKEKSFYQKLEAKTTQEMSVEKGGQPTIKQVQDQTFIIKWTAKDKKDNNYVLEQQIEEVKMNISIGTTQIAYDSLQQNQPQNPMTEFFGQLKKVKLTLFIDDKLKVVKVEGRNEFVTKLSESHPQMKNLLNSILSEKAIMSMSEQTWAFAIPPTARKKGDTWTSDGQLDMKAIGTYTNKYSYTYEGADKDIIKIKVVPTMTYAPPKDGSVSKEDALPFKIKDSSKLESVVSDKETTGSIEFDTKNGWIAKSIMKMEVKGKIVIEIGGADTTVVLTQNQMSTLTTADNLEAFVPKK